MAVLLVATDAAADQKYRRGWTSHQLALLFSGSRLPAARSANRQPHGDALRNYLAREFHCDLRNSGAHRGGQFSCGMLALDPGALCLCRNCHLHAGVLLSAAGRALFSGLLGEGRGCHFGSVFTCGVRFDRVHSQLCGI